jgi:hypothetical protein
VPKRLKTYRLEPDECAEFAWAVAQMGDIESDVLRAAIRAYIQRVRTGVDGSVPPVSEASVYTHPESPERYEEPAEEPPCRHPAEAVEAGECRACGADVW